MRIKQYIRQFILPVSILVATALPFAVSGASTVSAAVDCSKPAGLSIQDSINCGVDKTGTAPTCGPNVATDTCVTNKANSLVTTVVNLVSLIVGIVAVIMIIIAGLTFVTAGGDSARVARARSTILYAVVGLVVVAFAQIIVRFVLDKATK